MGALDLKGSVGFFASAESVTGPDKRIPLLFLLLLVGSDDVIIFGEFTGDKKRHKTRGNRIQASPTARSRYDIQQFQQYFLTSISLAETLLFIAYDVHENKPSPVMWVL